MELPRQAVIFTLVAAVLGLAAASHFRGAIINWRPVDPVNFDGRIVVTHRIAWRRSYSIATFCNASTISERTLIGEPGSITCHTGCSGALGSVLFQCTDFNVDEDWSAGQGSNEMNLTSVTNFEASYIGVNWIDSLVRGGGDWEVRVKGDLSPRADNGRVNSSPTTTISPIFRLRHGVAHTITIPVFDADGDVVQCRWAESAQDECGGVCQVFPATLDQDNCRLTYIANGTLGWYAVAIQVEDFISASSTVAMSSVPVQFLVQVEDITVPPGLNPPTFVGNTPEDGSCIIVENTYWQQITARSGGDNAIITDISTESPPGLMRSALTAGSNSREAYINVTFAVSAAQGQANIFCYTASDNFGLMSERRCITLLVGVTAPQLINVTLSGFGNGTFILSLEYDQQIARPSASRFVRVFQNDGMQILSVDVSTSTDAAYVSNTLTITTGTPFMTSTEYYLLADSGVAVATGSCPIESPEIDDPDEWVFSLTSTARSTCTSGGTTYVRWGRTVCPNNTGTELVYHGIAAGTFSTTSGGGANYICMANGDDVEYYTEATSANLGLSVLHHAEYRMQGRQALAPLLNHNVPCAVCEVCSRFKQVMIPGRFTCPDTWTVEYNGWLVADRYTHKRVMFICLDKSPEAESERSGIGSAMHHVEAACSTTGLPCSPYDATKELACVVCTK